jgi:hypothetical protein
MLECMYFLGRCLSTHGQVAEAEKVLRELLMVQERLKGAGDDDMRDAKLALARCLKNQGKRWA